MSKITVLMVSTSAPANPFLKEDGFINNAAFSKLAAEIDASNKEQLAASKATGKAPKTTTQHFYTRRPLAAQSTAAKAKTDLKYQASRASIIRARSTMPKPGTLKVVWLIHGLLEGAKPALLAKVAQAVKAIERHNKKAESLQEKIAAAKAKQRDAETSEFRENLDLLQSLLTDAGLKPANIVIGQTMFGLSAQVKLPNGGVVSITKSDTKKFNDARKAQG